MHQAQRSLNGPLCCPLKNQLMAMSFLIRICSKYSSPKKLARCLSLVCVVAFGYGGDAFSADNSTKPTRSDCIAGFELDWSNVKSSRWDIANQWGRPLGAHTIEPLTIVALHSDRSRLYLVFVEDCDKKREMAQSVIDYWASVSSEMPRFIWIEGPIIPSSKTVEFEGRYWRD